MLLFVYSFHLLLTLTYQPHERIRAAARGNQLMNIHDHSGSRNQYNVKEYQNKLSSGYNSNAIEMAYDANGNMIKDLDRDIVTIKYNVLNLPEIIQFKNGNQIRNLYDASGRKLQTKNITICYSLNAPLTEGDILTSGIEPTENEDVYVDGVDYCGNYEYCLGSYFDYYTYSPLYYNYLDKIYNSEGYTPPGSWNANSYYFRRDHLGNNREVISISPNNSGGYAIGIQQRTQYYPSGLPWASNSGDNPSAQNKKYNGKEFVEMHGWDESDFGARGVHHAKMRFDTFDPLAELRPWESPYAFCGNNPINNIDPTGLKWVVNGEGGYHWDPNDTKGLDVINGTDANGNFFYGDQFGKPHDSAPLEEFTATAEMPDHVRDMQNASYMGVYDAHYGFWNSEYTQGGIFLLSNLIGVGETAIAIEGLVDLGKAAWTGGKSLVAKILAKNAAKGGINGAKSLGAAAKGFTKNIIPEGFKETKQFGYQHGQKVYKYMGKFFSRDIDSHSGGVWKVFEEVGGKLERIGTADETLTIFKK